LKKENNSKQNTKKTTNTITQARSNAFKLLSASVHGYVAFFGARYFSAEASNSILAFVRKLTKKRLKNKEAGYKVIYADTDSVAFSLEKQNPKTSTRILKIIQNFQELWNLN